MVQNKFHCAETSAYVEESFCWEKSLSLAVSRTNQLKQSVAYNHQQDSSDRLVKHKMESRRTGYIPQKAGIVSFLGSAFQTLTGIKAPRNAEEELSPTATLYQFHINF